MGFPEFGYSEVKYLLSSVKKPMSFLSTFKANLKEEYSSGHLNKPFGVVVAGFVGLVWIHGYTKRLKRIAKENRTCKFEKEKFVCEHGHVHNPKMGKEVNFFQHLRRLLPVLVPKLFSYEVWSIARYIAFTIPAAYVNSLLKYLTARLSLALRMNLNKHVHEKYLEGVNFYDICNLGDYKIENVAERITVDTQHLAYEISDIYTSTFKPIMDIIFFTYKLAKTTTYRGPLILYSYFLFSSLCKMILAPPLGKLAAKESELQGDFRSAHERLITNSEEVAFYDGSKRERTIINKKLEQLHDQVVINSMSRLFINKISFKGKKDKIEKMEVGVNALS